jgi:hypothetical protein
MKLAPGMRSLMVAYGLRAEQQRPERHMQQPIGEDVTALDRPRAGSHRWRGSQVERHRFDGAHPVTRIFRFDLLLAGDQRDLVGADAGDDLVVDLASQQPQRQADQAGGVAEHSLNGEMGLAGIGRTQHGRYVSAARFVIDRH